jgi:Ca2+/Na+ antiporter
MDAESIALIVISAILGVTAVFLFFISYRQHKERGVIFTNTWITASKAEREKMDERFKKAEYRVGRNVFFMLGFLCSLYAVNFQLWISWLFYIGYAVMALIVVYAIAQSISNERLRKTIEDEKKAHIPKH